MTQTTAAHGAHAAHDHAPQAFIWKYVFSKDHKVIGIQYYVTAMCMPWLAGLLAMLIRLQLAWPEKTCPDLRRILNTGFTLRAMNPDVYALRVAMDVTIMLVFLPSTGP